MALAVGSRGLEKGIKSHQLRRDQDGAFWNHLMVQRCLTHQP